MKPKTRLQVLVDGLSRGVPGVTEKQTAWAFEHCFEGYAYRTKGELTCFECEARWGVGDTALLVNVVLDCVCPGCGKDLKLQDGRKRSRKDVEYFCVLGVYGGFQVVRFFWVERNCRVGVKARYFISEVVQNWIGVDGRVTVRALLCSMSGQFVADQWCFSSDMEVRKDWHFRYDIDPGCIYPVRRVLGVIKRNGFRGVFHGMRPVALFEMLLVNPRAETLFKAGQYGMMGFGHKYGSDLYWGAIRICMRNGYVIGDARMWFDHVDMLRAAGKDLFSARWVCPGDLRAEHARLIEKRRRADLVEALEERKEKISEAEAGYLAQKGRFLGMEFVDGDISVGVLRSVQDFFEEGEALRHCVFSGGYYLRADSLVFSAMKGGDRLETIEVSLGKMEVVQSRGMRNGSSEFHERILGLVRGNMGLIRERVGV